VIDALAERLEALEEDVVQGTETDALQELYAVRRDLIFLRKSVWPLREVVGQLRRGESDLVPEATAPFFADVHDHAVQVLESVDSFRDLASGLTDLHLALAGQRTNDVMKVLTVIATVFMPLGFLAGLYGMNFENMPELKWPWGYPALLGVMVALAATMFWTFRRRGWLG
jgi:magnesium transporter